MRETDRIAARVRTLLAGPVPASYETGGAGEGAAPAGGAGPGLDEVLQAGPAAGGDDALDEAAAGARAVHRAHGGGLWRRLAARAALRLDPGRRSALGVGVAVLAAALLAGGWLMLQRPQAAPVSARAPSVPITATPRGSGAPARAAAPPPSSSSSAPPAATQVVVDVAGKVHRPGLYRLPAGARIDDAVRSAGGPLPHVDLSRLNLASRLVDGQQILVGLPATAGPVGGGVDGGSTAGATSGASAGGVSAGATGPVDLNTASLAQLDALPGVGPVLAQHILDWRTAHGSFTGVDQLNDVSGIGDVKFAALRPLVTV